MKASNPTAFSNATLFKLAFAFVLIGQSLLIAGLPARATKPSPGKATTANASSAAKEAAARAAVDANYGKLPLSFEANRGQAAKPVRFMARGGNATLLIKPDAAVLTISREKQVAKVQMALLDANPNPSLTGLAKLPGKSSYFVGHDPKQWTTDVPNYAQVKYEQVYPGIDLLFYGNQQQLEYDFVVAPGADPKQIKLKFTGAQQMQIDKKGDLVLKTKAGEVRQHKPVIYQEVASARRTVTGRYVLGKQGVVGFELGEYDARLPLVIDPVFAYATFFGSRIGTAIAVDTQGNAYIAAGIPATAGAYSNGSTLSVAKLNATGTAVIYAATFGGSSDDRINDLAVDQAGSCYVTGRTESPLFPTTAGAFQTNFGRLADNNYNAFVLKLNPAGNALVYSTFLKGDTPSPITEPKVNEGNAIAIDAQGNAYVTGYTNTTDFPTTLGAFQPNIATFPSSPGNNFPPMDPFVTKLNPTGTGLVYSTFLGSASNIEDGKDIAVDKDGNAYVTCSTSNGYNDARRPPGTPFPVTPGAYQTTDTFGSAGGFIVRYASISKINPTGTALIYSTLIGSSPLSSSPVNVAIDNAGNAYVTGYTISTTFPVTPGAYKTTGGGKSTAIPGDDNPDCFITKFNASGSALVYSTYFGGNYVDRCFDLAVDGGGNAHVTGLTISSDFPQIGLPPHTIGVGEAGGFVTKLNATGSALLQSIFIKFSQPEALTLDTAGNAYVTGQAGLIQPTANAYQTTQSTGGVVKITSPRSFTSVSAASYTADLASESIVSAFGVELATTTQSAATTPLPTSMAGTTVKVRDSSGTERAAPLFFVSPTQINYLIPAGTAQGVATITVNSGDGTLSVATPTIRQVAPGLFTADASGQGLAAAVALRVKANGSQSFEPIARFDPGQSRFVPIPIDLGPEGEQVFLILYGTGIRFRSSLSAVSVTLGGISAPVSYAAEQGGLAGLDQVNVQLPRTLVGRGEVVVALIADGKAANSVRVSIK
jgi:uncharacterized protein (TIGR03437 family)